MDTIILFLILVGIVIKWIFSRDTKTSYHINDINDYGNDADAEDDDWQEQYIRHIKFGSIYIENEDQWNMRHCTEGRIYDNTKYNNDGTKEIWTGTEWIPY